MGAHIPGATRCPCCGTPAAPAAFVHPAVPVLLNVLARTEAAARAVAAARLELVECETCGLVFNRVFDSVPYGHEYFLDPTRSPRYRAHLDHVCDRLAERMAGRPAFSVIDVGAGQGTFLAHLAGRLGPRMARAHGFDPAFRAREAALPRPIAVTASPLDATTALPFVPNVVVTRHVIEHVPDPVQFLAAIRQQAGGAFELMVETPDVDHTLAHGLLHDFCYEHCALMSAGALVTALRHAGYSRIAVERVFGGEYLLAFASGSGAGPEPGAGSPAGREIRRLRRQGLDELARRFVPEHRERLRRARLRGRIALWGAAGKGALFAHLVDPERALIDVVVDIHPAKQGAFLPGTGHRVAAPADARRAEVRTVFVANPTYREEVAGLCREQGLAAEVECVGDRER